MKVPLVFRIRRDNPTINGLSVAFPTELAAMSGIKPHDPIRWSCEIGSDGKMKFVLTKVSDKETLDLLAKKYEYKAKKDGVGILSTKGMKAQPLIPVITQKTTDPRDYSMFKPNFGSD